MLVPACSDQRETASVPCAEERARRGATLLEYLVMISFVLVVCLIAVGVVGKANNASMTSSASAIENATVKGK